ncbi:mucin-12-like [Cherax quadricarinatus]
MTLGAEVELWLRSPDDYNITRLLGVSNLSLNGTIIVEGTTNQTMNMTCSDPTALFWLPSSTASVIAFTCQAYGYWMHSRGLCFQACKTKMRNVVCRFPFLYEGQEYSRCTAVSRRADQAGDDLVCGIVYNVTQNWQLKACDMDNTSSTCASLLDTSVNETLTCGGGPECLARLTTYETQDLEVLDQPYPGAKYSTAPNSSLIHLQGCIGEWLTVRCHKPGRVVEVTPLQSSATTIIKSSNTIQLFCQMWKYQTLKFTELSLGLYLDNDVEYRIRCVDTRKATSSTTTSTTTATFDTTIFTAVDTANSTLFTATITTSEKASATSSTTTVTPSSYTTTPLPPTMTATHFLLSTERTPASSSTTEQSSPTERQYVTMRKTPTSPSYNATRASTTTLTPPSMTATHYLLSTERTPAPSSTTEQSSPTERETPTSTTYIAKRGKLPSLDIQEGVLN